MNLTLHVGAEIGKGRWAGYHPVESLVVFADMGDRLTMEPGDRTALTLGGPFAQGLTVASDNLVLRAHAAAGAPPMQIHLEKHLPISSGLGGGSANAAAVLRACDPQGQVDDAALGADIPVCRLSRTAMMEGIGERVTPMPDLGTVNAVLVNPGVPVSTGAIFRAIDIAPRASEPSRTARTGTLLDRARSGTNDLQAPAIAQAPIIVEVLQALGSAEGCDLARMSGSGATCFGLFHDESAARDAAAQLSTRGWWAVACTLGDPA